MYSIRALCVLNITISPDLFCFWLLCSNPSPFVVLPVNVEEHISNQILSCVKLNVYKSAKGEIQHCQGRFSAYNVSGKTPLIHKGCVEAANKCVCVRESVCDH